MKRHAGSYNDPDVHFPVGMGRPKKTQKKKFTQKKNTICIGKSTFETAFNWIDTYVCDASGLSGWHALGLGPQRLRPLLGIGDELGYIYIYIYVHSAFGQCEIN